MKTENNKKTDEILSSLDGIKRAVPEGFFFTRLKARMEKDLLPASTQPGLLKPAYAFPLLVLILAVNAFAILGKKNTGSGDMASGNEKEILQSIAAEYNPSDMSSLYDLNEER
jgi:hypothetical protein